MIRNFKDKDAKAIFERRRVKKFPDSLAQRAFEKLIMLDAAERIDDLRLPPGNRLEALGGNRRGQWGIRINGQRRICFRRENGNDADVEICDYH
ncbi:MAG: type II toxin-antitoxin system RelE/ParE family toxin [Nitrospinae bacterium]|nr:type II toxin-antitoxin system RelE/ParE family toxin [Nitrospinota bacterium]